MLFKFLLLYTSTFLLTLVPAVTTLFSLYRDRWFTLDDLLRLAEPLVHLPLGLVILKARVLETWQWVVYGVSAALYQQGSGFHSFAVIAKNVVRDYRRMRHLEQDDELNSVVYYFRDVWEHVISHYMAALGFIGMTCVYVVVFRDLGPALGRRDRILLVLTSLVLGFLIAAIGINYDYGGFVFLPLSCLVVIAFFIFYRKAPLQANMLHTMYALAALLAILLQIIWFSIHGID